MMLKDCKSSQKLEKVKILGRRKVNWGAGEKVAAEMQKNWAQPVRPAVSLLAQLLKNLPVMQETPVQLLGQEDPLVKG